MPGRYIPRPLGNRILKSKKSVVILEGARAVGKTKLANEELVRNGYRYYTLADTRTYDEAKRDPASWIQSIGTPAVIDEAQRVDGLPLAVKEAVDRANFDFPQFVLTGSASIGKAGLDGQDPLTRRAERYTLHPLTKRELLNEGGNLADDLWDALPDESRSYEQDKREVILDMLRGGFPTYAVSGRAFKAEEHIRYILQDIDSILGDALVPSERFDGAISQEILFQLLAHPGSILNISRIGRELGYQDRTISSYVAMFLRRFLVRSLPNFGQKPGKNAFTRSKMHPIDASFSMAVLLNAGVDLESDPRFGEVFESYVVSQVLPAAQSAEVRSGCFYWREAGKAPKEVDLVLKRQNELLGIEVKSSVTVGDDDFKGLRALAADERFKKGYVVYLGSKVQRVSEKMWAIPVSSLYRQWESAETALPASSRPRIEYGVMAPVRTGAVMASEANVILSYNEADNEYLDGSIVGFAKSIGEEYEFQFGKSIRVLVKPESSDWEADWQNILKEGIEAPNMILPALTPRYIRAQECRDELSKMLRATEGASNTTLLSLVWQPLAADSDISSDPLWERLRSGLVEDVSSLRDAERKSREYKDALRLVVARVRECIVAADNGEDASGETGDSWADGFEGVDGLLDRVSGFSEKAEEFNALANRFVEAFGAVIAHVENNPIPPDGDAKAYQHWSARIALLTKKDLETLDEGIDEMNSFWLEFMDIAGQVVRLYSVLPPNDRMEQLAAFEGTLYSIKASFSSIDNAEALEAQFSMFRLLSPRLKPLSNGLMRAMRLLRDMELMLDDQIKSVRTAMG